MFAEDIPYYGVIFTILYELGNIFMVIGIFLLLFRLFFKLIDDTNGEANGCFCLYLIPMFLFILGTVITEIVFWILMSLAESRSHSTFVHDICYIALYSIFTLLTMSGTAHLIIDSNPVPNSFVGMSTLRKASGVFLTFLFYFFSMMPSILRLAKVDVGAGFPAFFVAQFICDAIPSLFVLYKSFRGRPQSRVKYSCQRIFGKIKRCNEEP